MSELYVSDSFTVNPATNGLRHYPGPFNMSQSWGPNVPVNVSLMAGAIGAIPYGRLPIDPAKPPAGLNIDVQIGLYDLASGGHVVLPFVDPFGSAPNGQVMNLVTIYGSYSMHPYDWSACPLQLGLTTPAVGGPFQLGAIFTFWLDPVQPIVTAYNYHLLGKAA